MEQEGETRSRCCGVGHHLMPEGGVRRPSMRHVKVVVPMLALLCVFLAGGIVAVMLSARRAQDVLLSQAQADVTSALPVIAQAVQRATIIASLTAGLLAQYPGQHAAPLSAVAQWFNLVPDGAASTLVTLYAGRYTAVYPPIQDAATQAWLNQLDVLHLAPLLPMAIANDTLFTIQTARPMVTDVAFPSSAGSEALLPVLYPVFAPAISPNETWGWPMSMSASECINGTLPCFSPSVNANVPGMKWWGEVLVWLNWTAIQDTSNLNNILADNNYGTAVTLRLRYGPPAPVHRETVIYKNAAFATCKSPVSNSSNALTPDVEWVMSVCMVDNTIKWRDPLIAVVVVVSCCLVAFLGWSLNTWISHSELVQALLPKQALQQLAQDGIGKDGPCEEVLNAGTPADRLINMLGQLLSGGQPPARDVVQLMLALKQQRDIYLPDDLADRLRNVAGTDAEVEAALMTTLGPSLRPGGGTPGNSTPGSAGHSGRLLLTKSRGHLISHKSGGAGGLALVEEDMQEGVDRMSTESWGLQDGLMFIMSGFKDAGLLAVHTSARSSRISTRSGSSRANSWGVEEDTLPSSAHTNSSTTPAQFTLNPNFNPTFAVNEQRKGRDEARSKLPILESGMQLVCTPPLYDWLEQVLMKAAWLDGGFDAWELKEASQNHALSALAFWVFHQAGLIQEFDINSKQLCSFLRCIESGYRDNPYHNRVHAADVLQSVHALLHQGGLRGTYADSLTTMACYLAAVVHDFDHRGVTNDYLINTQDELALMHNDRSPHENHHLCASFKVMRQPDNCFLAHLPKTVFNQLRRLMIDLVMATDMKQHFVLMGQFSSVHRLATSSMVDSITTQVQQQLMPAKQVTCSGRASLSLARGGEMPSNRRPGRASLDFRASARASLDVHAPPNNTNSGYTNISNSSLFQSSGASPSNTANTHAPQPNSSVSHQNAMGGNGTHSAGAANRGMPARCESLASSGRSRGDGAMQCPMPVDDAERLLSLQLMLKTADLGHICAPEQVHLQWVRALEEEMYRQGDMERAQGMQVSPLCDRTQKGGVNKSQVGFFTVCVLPLLANFVHRFPGAKPCLDAAVSNYKYWHREAAQQQSYTMEPGAGL